MPAKKRRAPGEDFPEQPTMLTLPTCSWKNTRAQSGPLCGMLASVWLGPAQHRDAQGEISRPGYCSWHVIAVDSPRLADDFDEFERWTLALLNEGYCTEFLHYPASYVWRTVQGYHRPAAERKNALPCRSARCWVLDVHEPEQSTHRVAPAEARAAIKSILDALSRKVTP